MYRLTFYRAFSTVVADNQFSTLGIVLVATLARFAKATGINYSKLAHIEVKTSKNISAKSEEDRGERIVRIDDVDVDAVSDSRKQRFSKMESEEKSSKDKVKRLKSSAKKKKKNAIDDIFGGL